jgi:cytochrome c oxidase subunit 2
MESGKAEGSLAANGEKLFQQFGCTTCHRPDSGARGPNLEGLYGRPVRLQDNRVIIADENYIRESILDPNAKIVNGFQPIMPTFRGVISEEGMVEIIAYIKSMSEQTGQPLNNRTTPTDIRDTEVPNVQQQMQKDNQNQKPSGKQP